jgi:hypothetical protein
MHGKTTIKIEMCVPENKNARAVWLTFPSFNKSPDYKFVLVVT